MKNPNFKIQIVPNKSLPCRQAGQFQNPKRTFGFILDFVVFGFWI